MNVEMGNRLQEVRKKNGYSQEQLADLLGVSRQAVSKWERGEASPDTDNLIKLAKLYDMSIDELLLNQKGKSQSESCQADDNIEVIDACESEENCKELNKRQKLIVEIVSGVSIFISLIVYMLLGVCLNLWHPAWIVFLLLPVTTSLTDAILTKNGTHFAFPVIVVAVYLILGLVVGNWHPSWVVFLTIPVYYIVFDVVESFRSKNK